MVLYESVLIFIGSLIVLVKASDVVVDRAMHVSRHTGLSQIAVGAIILALGTSLPELAVTIISSINGQPSLAFGTIIGSNITNLTLMFGVSALFGVVIFKRKDLERSWIIALSSGLALLLLIRGVADIFFGIIALVVFFLFVNYTLIRGYSVPKMKEHSVLKKDLAKDVLILFGGIVFVLISAVCVVASKN